jgi:hypothetical protein
VKEATGAVIRWNPSEEVAVDGLDSRHRLSLSKDEPVTIGNGPSCRVVVRGVRLGGRTNCIIRLAVNGSWVLQHVGHALAILVNGAPLLSHGVHELSSGDRIEPLTTDGVPGPCFTFLLEPPDPVDGGV